MFHLTIRTPYTEINQTLGWLHQTGCNYDFLVVQFDVFSVTFTGASQYKYGLKEGETESVGDLHVESPVILKQPRFENLEQRDKLLEKKTCEIKIHILSVFVSSTLPLCSDGFR